MPENIPIISEAVLRAVHDLDLRTRRNISSLLAGNYRSAFRGSGMQFKEFRHYEPGDDIRHMSWHVTARTGHATVKVFEEERELDVICMVDVSGSSMFGAKGKRKVDMYAELLALVGLAAVKSGDNLGLMLFHEKPQLFLPPKRNRSQVLAGLTHVLSQPMRGTRSDVGAALNFAASILHNQSLVLVFSDFLSPPFQNELQILGRRHEVILLHGYDDVERGFGMNGVYEVCDPESGEFFLLDGNSGNLKKTLRDYQTNLSTTLQNAAEASRADYLSLSTDDDYLQRLVRFFRMRGPSRI